MKIIEFAGTPDSGKTTAARGLMDLLNSKGIKTEFIVETRGKNLFPKEQRGTLDYNVKVGTITCKRILERLENTDADVVLIDKGYVDYLFWIDYYISLGKATESEAERARKLLHDSKLIPDLFIGLTVNPEVAMRRCEDAIETRTVKLKEHNEAFESFFTNYSLTPKFLLDTSDLGRDEVVEILAKEILAL